VLLALQEALTYTKGKLFFVTQTRSADLGREGLSERAEDEIGSTREEGSRSTTALAAGRVAGLD
jgi:hypothetical protein